jgi:hypothetical protein
MVKEVKRGSSPWLKTKDSHLSDFAWQNGYGIFSSGFSQVEVVRNYIAEQEEHHRKVTFQVEQSPRVASQARQPGAGRLNPVGIQPRRTSADSKRRGDNRTHLVLTPMG